MIFLSKIFRVLVLTLPLFAMNPAKPLKVIFFGDSITQAGVGPKGYITQAREILKSGGKDGQYELIGAGIGGNKIYDLYLRLESDVLSQNPDVVFMYVGINDVWHKSSLGTGTDPNKYVQFYEAMIKKFQEKKIKIILCTPSVIGERNDNSNPQDGDLNHYSNLIRELGNKYQLPVCDLRNYFQEYLSKNNPTNLEKGVLTTDRVHLNEAGNKFLAEKIVDALLK